MKMLKKESKLLIFTILALAGIFFNTVEIVAEGNILYEKNYMVKLDSELLIEIISADIQVISWDNDKVSIVVVGNNSINNYLEFDFLQTSSAITLTTKKKKDWNSWGGFKNFKVKVKVPQKFNLSLKTSGGDIVTKSVIGKKVIATSGGDIEIKDSEGKLVAKTSGGDIEIDKFIGAIEVKTSGGDIEGKNIDGSVIAKTSGGDIELSVSNGSVEASTSGGDVSLNYIGKNNGVELYTSGGNITANIPSDFSADVVLKASGGDIDNNFKNIQMSKITKSKFEGKFNDGGALFSAKTSGGYISVTQK